MAEEKKKRKPGSGGARPNAGRKRKDASGLAVTLSFCCSPAQKEMLEAAARERGISRSDYINSKLF